MGVIQVTIGVLAAAVVLLILRAFLVSSAASDAQSSPS